MNLRIRLYKPNPELTRLYVAGILRQAANTLVTLFSPVYIFSIFMEKERGMLFSISVVFCFYSIILICKLVFDIAAENFGQKIGLKTLIRLSFIPYILNIVLLVFSKDFPALIIFAGIFGGMHAGLYWWGYQGYFIRSGNSRHLGESVGELDFLNTLVSIVTPIVGGVLIQVKGFYASYFLALIFIILAIVTLRSGGDKLAKRDVRIKDVLALVKKHYFASLAYFGASIESIYYILVWPVFLFIVFGRVIDLGLLVGLAAFISSLFSIGVGRWIDKKGEIQTITLGSVLLSLSWFMKMVFSTFSLYAIAESIENFSSGMSNISLQELSYRKAVEGDLASGIMFREITSIFGGLILMGVMFLWVVIIGNIQLSFIIPCVGALLPLTYVAHKIRNAN